MTGKRQSNDRQVTVGTAPSIDNIEQIERIEQIEQVEQVESKGPRSQFSPPTAEDVKRYCDERGVWLIDPERFVNYYAARGWELSKGRRMRDWKAAVRLWEKNERDRSSERDDSDIPY